jgi:Bacterial Ig-like domain (group 1)
MHKFLSVAVVSAFTMLLAACGGNAFQGASSSSGGGTTPTAKVAVLSVSSDVASVPLDGSSAANITVIAKDAKSAVVSGATVTFAASGGGTVTTTQGTTDANGVAKATLVAGTAAAGSTITVTATSGTITGTTTVQVAQAKTSLNLLTSLTSIPSDGSKTATITAYVRDANNNFVSGAVVGFQASSGGLTVTKGTTDTSGSATATLSSAGDPTNRSITVTAKVVGSSGAAATVTVGVVGTKLTVSGPPTLVQGATGTYTVSLTDASGSGIANQTVTITSASGNALTPSTFTTDATGQKTFTVTGSVAGNDTITVPGASLKATQAVAVSNQNCFHGPDRESENQHWGCNADYGGVDGQWHTTSRKDRQLFLDARHLERPDRDDRRNGYYIRCDYFLHTVRPGGDFGELDRCQWESGLRPGQPRFRCNQPQFAEGPGEPCDDSDSRSQHHHRDRA